MNVIHHLIHLLIYSALLWQIFLGIYILLIWVSKNIKFHTSPVINVSETTNWRISWIITLQYDTTIDQLKKIRDEIEKYITSLGQLDYIETELLATTYAIESIKDFGAKAIKNLLYDKGSTGLSSGEYAAVYSDETAFRDALSPTNIDAVVERMNTLVTTAVNMLSPARLVGRKSGKNMLYNTGYYKEEIQNIINTQFGAGTWDSDYANWLEDLVNDIVHDTVSTDISDSSHAYDIVIKDVVGAFTVGEQVSSSGGGTSKVLE